MVINNAGVYGPQISLETVTAEDMLFTYQANTIGPLLVVQQLLKNKLIGKPGSLVGPCHLKGRPPCNLFTASFTSTAPACQLLLHKCLCTGDVPYPVVVL